MTDKGIKKIYRDYIEEIFNNRDLDKLDQYVSNDYVLHDAPPHIPKGKESIAAVVHMFNSAFSDFKVSLDELISEGDLVASKSTFVGTHSGKIFGMKATGKKIRMSSLTLVRIRDGKVYESWVKNDIESLRTQLT